MSCLHLFMFNLEKHDAYQFALTLGVRGRSSLNRHFFYTVLLKNEFLANSSRSGNVFIHCTIVKYFVESAAPKVRTEISSRAVIGEPV
jgi:hypothetical protein